MAIDTWGDSNCGDAVLSPELVVVCGRLAVRRPSALVTELDLEVVGSAMGGGPENAGAPLALASALRCSAGCPSENVLTTNLPARTSPFVRQTNLSRTLATARWASDTSAVSLQIASLVVLAANGRGSALAEASGTRHPAITRQRTLFKWCDELDCLDSSS